MANEALRLVSAFGIFFLSGFVLFNIIDRRDSAGLGPVFRCAAAFMAGLGAVSLQMLIYSFVPIPYNFFSVSIPWVVILAASLLLPALRPASLSGRGPAGLKGYAGWFEALLAALILLQAVYALTYFLAFPVRGWDAWSIWFFKARVIFLEKGLPEGFFRNASYGYSHQDYPLMIPLSAAWVYTALGKASEVPAKLLFPLQFLSLLMIFHFAVKKTSGLRLSLIFTLMLSLTPVLLAHAAGLPNRIGPLYMGDYTGYSDLALSAYFLGAGAFIYLYSIERRPRLLLLAALFLGAGAWTKNEGLPFALLGGAFIAAHMIGLRRERAFYFMAAAAILIAFIAPWAAYKSYWGLESEYSGRMRPDIVAAGVSRLPYVIKNMLSYMFTQIDLYNFTWWAYALSAVLNRRSLFAWPLLALNSMVVIQFGSYALIYAITPADLDWLLATSLDRLIMHMTPLSMMITAVNTGILLYGKKTG